MCRYMHTHMCAYRNTFTLTRTHTHVNKHKCVFLITSGKGLSLIFGPKVSVLGFELHGGITWGVDTHRMNHTVCVFKSVFQECLCVC